MTQGKRTPAKAAPRKTSQARATSSEAKSTRSKSSPQKRTAQSSQPATAIAQAKRTARKAKKVATKKIIEARDVTVEAVTGAASEVGSSARRAASATAAFVSANAVPLTLLGLGTGWLALAVQRRRRRNQAVLNAALAGEPLPEPSRDLLEQGREKLSAMGGRAAEGAQHAGKRVKSAASSLGERAIELGHDARDGLIAAEQRTRELAREHPVAASAVAVATGVGIAMALPDSALEKRVLGPARGKIAEEAKAAFDEVKSGVQSAIETATEIKNDVVARVAR
jgi:ElaB/YqjD/DUF883 family membrane-anchored ribosome-binding protein